MQRRSVKSIYAILEAKEEKIMTIKIFCPGYFRIIKKSQSKWASLRAKPVLGVKQLLSQPQSNLLSSSSQTIGLEDIQQSYQISSQQIVLELFKLEAGKDGFYLVNLRDRLYYYCGLTLTQVKHKLNQLGIDQPSSEEANLSS